MNAQKYGVFHLNQMQLAFDLNALREIVPCAKLLGIPCAAPYIVGAIDLRGLLVPVLDLCQLLQLSGEKRHEISVVIMAYEGHLLGILADGAMGVFECAKTELAPVIMHSGNPAVLCGSFQRADDLSLVSVLSPAAFAALPDVPMVSSSALLHMIHEGEANDPAQFKQSSYVMLMRCGNVALAMTSDTVHTTILTPRLNTSALKGGYCLGVLDYAGMNIPAVDLFELLGLEGGKHRCQQAFLMQFPEGLVAFMVDEIIDVVAASLDNVIRIPPHALQQQQLFSGALTVDELPAHSQSSVTAGLGYYLLVDSQGLFNTGALVRLSTMNLASEYGTAASADVFQSGGTSQRIQILTYDVGGEVGSPVAQITEILPWRAGFSSLSSSNQTLGLLMSRGRAIPVFCLCGLLGLPVVQSAQTASVLVVEINANYVGFMVPRLISIEDAPPPSLAESHTDSGQNALAGKKNIRSVLAGSGGNEHMISIIDLTALARQLVFPEPVD